MDVCLSGVAGPVPEIQRGHAVVRHDRRRLLLRIRIVINAEQLTELVNPLVKPLESLHEVTADSAADAAVHNFEGWQQVN